MLFNMNVVKHKLPWPLYNPIALLAPTAATEAIDEMALRFATVHCGTSALIPMDDSTVSCNGNMEILIVL
jgi:hypothetical protein